MPPRVMQARKFLAERGLMAGQAGRTGLPRRRQAGLRGWSAAERARALAAAAQANATASWQAVGPPAVQTAGYGPVTGRVSALALDPSDATGNRLYVGTTGGGVWAAQNAAADLAAVSFSPLTDDLEALSGIRDASISIGAVTVQPTGTGVVLAGTGDPNDALDSYYGAGILRSADGGKTWTLIETTADLNFAFTGEGFAGFAWSTVDPQVVVAAVSQAYEGTLVNAGFPGKSYEGLYVSMDAGMTWALATITDGSGADVQGPTDLFVTPDGNAATAVVWNPVRQMFVAAVRFHGYYQSPDGVTWTRMAAQPGAGLTASACPTNYGSTGSIACPIWRGALAVNPQTGDTFAWTVDANNQDQGMWQDQCAIVTNSNGASSCGNPAVTFAQQWNTGNLETKTLEGAATIENGDYALALAAFPAGPGLGQDTTVLAGATDLWKCSLAEGCVWRNTTNAGTCMSAGVAPFQHALAWNAANPLEIFVGNDSGLWRSLDGIGETGMVCAASDAMHFQNLNGTLGSLAEVESLAVDGATAGTMMAGLGVNGTAGVNGVTGFVNWPQILGGYGGPVAIDPKNSANWYVNDEAGVSIYLCSQPDGASPVPCTPVDFGTTPVVTDADVGGDGATMEVPAPFLVDPADPTQLLIGTCRVWRGPADGSGWTSANAISPILDTGATAGTCSGDALIRSMAALPLAGGGEAIYVGMYGALNGGANLAGHVLRASVAADGSVSAWNDLTLNPVGNGDRGLNVYGEDISSIAIDSHDPTGNTVYVTEAGIANPAEQLQTVYQSTDGGAQWTVVTSNLPETPANSVVVDPGSASTVYLATDVGVFFTTEIAACANPTTNCWAEFGTGLPKAPVVQLNASPARSATQMLTAGTYGRGIWQTPLCSASGAGQTSASVSAQQLEFGSEAVGSSSPPQTVTVTNTGSVGLTVASIGLTDSADFSEMGNCIGGMVAPGSSCTVNATFSPQAAGSLTSEMAFQANVCGGQVTVNLSGTGTSSASVTLSAAVLPFGDVPVGTSPSPQLSIGVNTPIAIASVTATAPFSIVSSQCGASFTPPGTCQVTVAFTPVSSGPVTGTLTVTDAAGTQTAVLTGTGEEPATDLLNPASLTFPSTGLGQPSAAQMVTLTNTGDLPLLTLSTAVMGPFQVSGTCGPSLAAHSACAVSVVFDPAQLGPASGVLTVTDAQRAQMVALSGTGVTPGMLSVSPASLTFAAQAPGVASAPQILTVSNTGAASLANVGFQIGGLAAASYSIGTTSCGATLAGGATCTLAVTFTAASTGASPATLTVSSATTSVTPVVVPLNGTAQSASGLNVSPAQINFGAVVAGGTSAAQTVTVSNTSSMAAGTLTFGVTQGFTVTQYTCEGSLAAGAACTLGVSFAPAGTGAALGTLTVSSASIATPATVVLTGTGAVAAGIGVAPVALTFPVTGVGQTSSAMTVTVTNSGAASSLSGLALTTPPGFVLVNNNCAAALGPGANCTAGVEFAPTAPGAAAGNLTISATGLSPVSVPLTGTGFDFSFAVSGQGSQTVNSGGNAIYTLAVMPLNGASTAGAGATFAFACGTLPAKAACILNPLSDTVNAGSTGNVTAQITTGSVSAQVKRPGGWSAAGGAALVCGLVLLPLGRKRRKALLLAALGLMLAAGATSCTSSGGGTGGGAGGGGGATPPGTYSIVVTATANNVQRSVTLMLTVD